jgi:hypothetical protein
MGDFPSQINTQPAIGVAGAFAAHNPRNSFIAGPGGLVAGSLGLTVGNFAWVTYPPDSDGTPSIANNFGSGPVAGFVHNEQQGLIQVYLQNASLLVPAGFPVTIETVGDFFAVNAGATQAQYGMQAFANIATGAVSFAAAGTIAGGASGATSAIVSTTLTLVGGVAGNVLTVASISAGSIYKGAILNSNAVGTVVKQLTGTANGVGTYLLDTGEQSVAAGTTIGGLYGVITFGTVTGGPFTVGMVLTGTGVVAGTVITDTITGGATSGTMVTNPNTAVSSATIVGSSVVATKWYARSTGLAGEVVKISSTVLG